MGVKLLGIASTYPPRPNPLPPGEGKLLRLTFCMVAVGHDTECGGQRPPDEKPLKSFFAFSPSPVTVPARVEPAPALALRSAEVERH